MKVRDLPALTGTPSHVARPMLLCRTCGETYSAERGDYFMRDPGSVLRCHGRPLVLVTKHTEYRRVKV
jgi:hypothetical protein